MSLALLDLLLGSREPLALCTVMQVKGSAPRHPGSWMLAGPAGLVAGSVGGGGGEAVVLDAAREALADGKARVLEVEKLGTEAEGPEMVCGGTALILVEPVGSKSAYASARELLSRGERALLARRTATGESFAMDRSGVWAPAPPAGADRRSGLGRTEGEIGPRESVPQRSQDVSPVLAFLSRYMAASACLRSCSGSTPCSG